ncbi:MAG: AAA family ATPase [Nocardioidaceae bacterium]|nr:AAA family ATPase [Nocardioidaceae bacterium]
MSTDYDLATQTSTDREYLRLRAAVVDARHLDQLPTPAPLVDGLLMLDSIAWLHGKPGHGKSFLALDIACSVASGRPWRGEHTTSPGVVLYVVAEGAAGIRQRVEAWETFHSTQIAAGRLKFLPVAVQLLGPSLAALVEVVSDWQPALVVIDTQARVTVGADENSSLDMGRYVDAVERLRAASGACVLTVHHESRAGDTLRGSTALEGAATTVLRVVKTSSTVRLEVTKQKEAPPLEPMQGRLAVVVTDGRSSAIWSHDCLGPRGAAGQNADAIRDALRDHFGTDGASTKELREHLGLAKSSFDRAKESLLSRREIVNRGADTVPRWFLAGSELQS